MLLDNISWVVFRLFFDDFVGFMAAFGRGAVGASELLEFGHEFADLVGVGGHLSRVFFVLCAKLQFMFIPDGSDAFLVF